MIPKAGSPSNPRRSPWIEECTLELRAFGLGFRVEGCGFMGLELLIGNQGLGCTIGACTITNAIWGLLILVTVEWAPKPYSNY